MHDISHLVFSSYIYAIVLHTGRIFILFLCSLRIGRQIENNKQITRKQKSSRRVPSHLLRGRIQKRQKQFSGVRVVFSEYVH